MTTLLERATPFSENCIGTGLTLTNDDSYLTIDANQLSLDLHRMCRSEYGVATIRSSVEMYAWTPSGSGIASNVVTGIVNQLADPAKTVGEDANGYGFNWGGGKLRNNNVVVATFTPVALNSFVTIALDPNTGGLNIIANGVLLGSYNIGAGGTTLWFYAASLAGSTSDLSVWANAGQTPFRYNANTDGWLHARSGITPFYIATEPFIAAPSDTVPNRKYYGDLDRSGAAGAMKTGRFLNFWPWGSSKPSGMGSGNKTQIPINDPLHSSKYTQLMTLDIRDQLVNIARVAQGGTVAQQEPMFIGLIDHCEQISAQQKMLYCTDLTGLLQQQPYRPVYPPNVYDSTLAGLPYPMNFGINRTFLCDVYDSSTTPILYRAGDTVIAAVGKSRDAGKEQALGIDYFASSDGLGFTRNTAPAGKNTYETTDYGGTITSTSTDALNGDGVFATNQGTMGYQGYAASTTSMTVATGTGKAFTLTGAPGLSKQFTNGSQVQAYSTGSGAAMIGTVTSYNTGTSVLTINCTSISGTGTHTDWRIDGGVNQPTGWTCDGGYFSQDNKNTVCQVQGGHFVRQANSPTVASTLYTMKHNTFTVAAGQSIAVQVVLAGVPYNGPGVDAQGNPITITPGKIMIGGWPAADQNGTILFQNWGMIDTPAAGTYTLTVTNNASVAMPFVLGMLTSSVIQGSGNIFSYFDITSIKAATLPSILSNVTLSGPPLDTILQQVVINHGPFGMSTYDQASAQAIDAATGYVYGIHVKSTETPNLDAMVKAILTSCTADRFTTRGGKLSFTRLIAPESYTGSIAGSLVDSDLVEGSALEPWPDLAENLSTRMSGCLNIDKYTDADFANVSLNDVPQVVRELLKKDYQWTVTSNTPVSPKYNYAQKVKPISTCFDRQADGQAEISRVCGIYASPRNFYKGDFFTDIGRVYELGQVWNVTNTQVDTLVSGQNLLLVGIEDSPTEGKATLYFWGL